MEASSGGSAIGDEGSVPSTLLLDTLLLSSDVGRGSALRIYAAARSLPLAIASVERLNFSMSSSIIAGSSGDYKRRLD